jgi:septum formation protein
MSERAWRLILASDSPRRREILSRLGLAFEVIPAGLEEGTSEEVVEDPGSRAEALALAKARAVAQKHPEDLVLGADTLVCLGTRSFGKPRDEAEARQMLQALSGRSHRVVTGVALVGLSRGLEVAAYDETLVTFRKLSEREIASYASSGEPMDKAGAYAVQGKASLFVERVEGEYDTVVGLPLKVVARLLEEAGLDIWPLQDEGD